MTAQLIGFFKIGIDHPESYEADAETDEDRDGYTFVALKNDTVINVMGTNGGRSMMNLLRDKYPANHIKTCCVHGCTYVATDGAHVFFKSQRKILIVPMCHDCNVEKHQDQPSGWTVKKGTKAVRIDPGRKTMKKALQMLRDGKMGTEQVKKWTSIMKNCVDTLDDYASD